MFQLDKSVMAFHHFWLIILLTLYVTSLATGSQSEVVVETTLGTLKGLVREVDGESLFQFNGIPFAKPPVGNLRFQKPLPAEPWTGIKDATKFGYNCMQSFGILDVRPFLSNPDVSEDCLTLQVYVPRTMTPEVPRPVMVWIYGGGFLEGTAGVYDGTSLAQESDVIVVTLNYRVGIFGFMSTGDSVAPGNYGLWDQRLAIQWVKDNIEKFGGNPLSITLFGESAGGMSVGFQAISPLNKGLFQRAIMQSGSMRYKGIIVKNALDIAIELGKGIGCVAGDDVDHVDTADLVDCLREKDANDLMQISGMLIFPNPETAGIAFQSRIAPRVDGDFLQDTPENIFRNRKSASFKVFESIDLMAGVTDSDGAISLFQFYLFQAKYGIDMTKGIPIRLVCDVIAPAIADQLYEGNNAVRDAICRQYTSDNIKSLDLAAQGMRMVDLLGDMHFLSMALETLNAHTQSDKTTYSYVFSQPSPNPNFIPLYPAWAKGSRHGDEIPFLFDGFKKFPEDVTVTEGDLKVAQLLRKMWSNFAKTGNPNTEDLPVWKPYDQDRRAYFNFSIDNEISKTEFNIVPDRMKLWLETIPSLMKTTKEEL